MFYYYLFIDQYYYLVNWLEAHLLPCPSKWLLDFDCPGCGLQTSVIMLLRGNFYQSLQIYPATILIIAMLVFLLLHLKWRFTHGTKILTVLYFFCATIILAGYIYKILSIKH